MLSVALMYGDGMTINSRRWMTPYPRYEWQAAINQWLLRHDPQRQALIALAEAEYENALADSHADPGSRTHMRLLAAMRQMMDA